MTALVTLAVYVIVAGPGLAAALMLWRLQAAAEGDLAAARAEAVDVPVVQSSAARLRAAVALLVLALPAAVHGQAVIGQGQPYQVLPDLSTATLGAGGLVWRTELRVPGASFLKAHFVNVHLAPGDRVVLYSSSGREVETLTGRGPKDRGTFWGLSAPGEAMTVEFHFSDPYQRIPFEIDQVIAGEQGFGSVTASVCWAPSFEDSSCYSDDPVKWANARASVGVLSVGGNPGVALFCSGSNVSPQNMVLTNDHCIPSQADCDNAEVLFGYHRTGCNDGSPPVDWVAYRCDEVVVRSPSAGCTATAAALDFALLSVIGDPAATFGWVEPEPATVTAGEDLYIVQHPDGRPQEITHGAAGEVDGAHLAHGLDTEGGSSGSPVFRESDGKLVGLHHCGGCLNSAVLMSEIYPLIEPYLGPAVIFADGFETGAVVGWAQVGGAP